MKLSVQDFSGPLSEQVFPGQFEALAEPLRRYLARQEWFNRQGRLLDPNFGLWDFSSWSVGKDVFGLCELAVPEEDDVARYFLPLALRRVEQSPLPVREQSVLQIAQVGSQWTLYEAWHDPAFLQAALGLMSAPDPQVMGRMRLQPEAHYSDLIANARLSIYRRRTRKLPLDFEWSSFLDGKFSAMPLRVGTCWRWDKEGERYPWFELRRDPIFASGSLKQWVEEESGNAARWAWEQSFVDADSVREFAVPRLEPLRQAGKTLKDLHEVLSGPKAPGLYPGLGLDHFEKTAEGVRVRSFEAGPESTPEDGVKTFCQSLSEAAAQALGREGGDGEKAASRVAGALELWAHEAQHVFLQGYADRF